MIYKREALDVELRLGRQYGAFLDRGIITRFGDNSPSSDCKKQNSSGESCYTGLKSVLYLHESTISITFDLPRKKKVAVQFSKKSLFFKLSAVIV